ncbi:unnamed protein product, partial [marine sediment metagenome]
QRPYISDGEDNLSSALICVNPQGDFRSTSLSVDEDALFYRHTSRC